MTDTITLPRAVIEQTIDALTDLNNGLVVYNGEWHTRQHVATSRLRAALAQQAVIRNFDLIGFLPSEEKRQQTVISQTELRAVLARKPLSDKHIQDLIHSKHFDKSYTLNESDKVILNWYRLGIKDGERAHGIGGDK